jgi:uncharacterized damage-inducible protein DinB
MPAPTPAGWHGRRFRDAERHVTGFTWLWAHFTYTAHHRAQAEVYLRVQGTKPPDYQF